EQGVTFLLVEHNMEFVMDICDTVAVLEHGSVIAMGEPEVIRNDPRVLDAYLGGAVDDEAEDDITATDTTTETTE
ncbi:MAG TPA: hypothetical protein VHX38_21415, partial [Pseudonocardiaceae bacterium]|nr:hypothetical protein [Pseudonocardiaceae bacterium]